MYVASWHHFCLLGICTVNVTGFCFTVILPRCCSAMFLQLDRPSPVPFMRVVNSGSNTLGSASSGIAGPSFSKMMHVSCPLWAILTLIFPFSSPIAWTAL